eukprot:TRINITY_DN24720_c0_g1_i1.p1 TRINITY_DN24720_c0_g1~~TRINITY_DN24720_c0_g1_i1.p1  ORF type:complete len:107 (-),score=9.76 TRINITY_DN24720_c0_g1_i1:28-348(-)
MTSEHPEISSDTVQELIEQEDDQYLRPLLATQEFNQQPAFPTFHVHVSTRAGNSHYSSKIVKSKWRVGPHGCWEPFFVVRLDADTVVEIGPMPQLRCYCCSCPTED